MEGRLFKVRLSTYKEYFVIANTFDAAALKAVEQYEKEEAEKVSTSFLTEDGSINKPSEKKVFVQTVEFINEKLIQ